MARTPVVLVHGIDDTHAIFGRMQPHLEQTGFAVHCLDLIPSDGKVGLAELARQVDMYIRQTFPAGETIDLVGFSMGGLVCRYYIQRRGGVERVRRFVTIGTPHNGTRTAYLRANSGARDMRPGSAFLEDLTRDEDVLKRVSLVSIWTPFDLMIVPAGSSRVRVGRSIAVWTLAHPLLVRDRRVLELVRDILSE